MFTHVATLDLRRPLAILVAATLVLASCGGALSRPAAPSQPAHSPSGHASDTPLSAKRLAFHDGMRRLWEDHVTWTRLFIVSFAADLPDADATAGRLLRNQDDIGRAIAPYYGDAAGTKLTGLLKEHILVAVDVLRAAKSGDAPTFEAANKKWYGNMNEISTFLSVANPEHWPIASLQPMMRLHLDLTLAEAAARLKGDWAADIAAYEKVHTHILELADLLSDGIARQFPDKFE